MGAGIEEGLAVGEGGSETVQRQLSQSPGEGRDRNGKQRLRDKEERTARTKSAFWTLVERGRTPASEQEARTQRAGAEGILGPRRGTLLKLRLGPRQ